MDQAPSPRSPWLHATEAAAPEAGSLSRSRQVGTATGSGPLPSGNAQTGAFPAAYSPTGTSSIRVLVVDDQPDVLATTVELFKIMGYDVLWANNGLKAVAILQQTPDVQVLFSDVVMPGMNGVKLAAEARRLIPGINVILASGFQPSTMEGQDAGDLHDFHFLSKPFRMADIARMLRR